MDDVKIENYSDYSGSPSSSISDIDVKEALRSSINGKLNQNTVIMHMPKIETMESSSSPDVDVESVDLAPKKGKKAVNFLFFSYLVEYIYFFALPCYSSTTIRWKAKVRIPKLILQENKVCQIFRKTNIAYALYTHTLVCVSGDKKCLFFGKIWRCLSSCNTRFGIRPFAFHPF